jgi:hypothetical protein
VGSVPVLNHARGPGSSSGSASWKRVSEALTGSTDTRMAEERPSRFTPGRDISLTLLRKIARDAGLTVEEFLARD